MLTLDATTASLEVVLAGAITTNQLPIVSSWADKTTTTFTPGKTTTATNSTSTVTIVAAPAASTQREVHSINVYNADTVAATITIRENDNSTLRPLVKITLNVGDTLFYTHANGWRVTDSTGAEKTNSSLTLTGDVTGSGSSSIVTTVAKIQGVTVSGTTGTGNVVFSASPTFTGTVGCAALTPTGLIDISGASAGQIKFPSTQNASSDAHTFDFYEEGTWTPSITFGGGSTGVTYGTRQGNYRRLAATCEVNGQIILTSKGSSTGAAFITGLPFAHLNSGARTTLATLFDSISAGITTPQADIQVGGSSVELIKLTAGSAASLLDSDCTNTTQVICACVYPTAT